MADTQLSDEPHTRGATLHELQESGAQHFNPVRFRFIESMARRAQAQSELTRQIVEAAARNALDEYIAEFSLAREKAAVTLKGSANPSAQVQQLFEEGRFTEMHRLLANAARAKESKPLVSLAQYISKCENAGKESLEQESFDDILRQHENELINSTSVSKDTVEPPNPEELNSIRRFREALVVRNADKLVSRAIEEIPEGAGPLNPQKLIVQSLASMRDLSPHYLNRFVSYIDTLLWLEEAGRK
ncbi:MAG: DUF2894 domain-containing protein [Proteobacteria bacterium]|nr:DUF2894 domain-containing protein [Pseudomonadota bacterium]